MRSRIPRTLVALAWLILPAAAGGAGREPYVPPALQPWVPWVLAHHPELGCPLVAGSRLCAWPGRLELSLDERGGRFVLEVAADSPLDLPLPGSAAAWPGEVTDNGRAALLRRRGEVPVVALEQGSHRLAGRFSWQRLPEALAVPPEIGLLELAVGGERIAFPRREDNGLVWLARSRGEEETADEVQATVSRRIDDGVPVHLTTQIELKVSGESREVDLGTPLPPGFTPIKLASSLPARLVARAGERAHLIVQLRPGESAIELEAVSVGPVAELASTELPPPWPAEEFWVFVSDPAVQTVRLEGAAPIDGQRTPLPEAWRSLTAFRLAAGDRLTIVEVARGEAAVVPDQVAVARTLWLAEDGASLTARDHLQGTLARGGRLEALAPAAVGRASLTADGEGGEVVTLGPASGRPGVEVREGELHLTAELELPRRGEIPAVGWDRDAQSLTAVLNLPPGWTLLAAPGTDRADGAWIERWNLLDLFFLLLASLATWRLAGLGWALIAFAAFGLSWYEPHGTALWVWWLVLMVVLALSPLAARVSGPSTWPARLLRWSFAGSAVAFAVVLLLFATAAWRDGLFPQLGEGQPRHADAWNAPVAPAEGKVGGFAEANQAADETRASSNLPPAKDLGDLQSSGASGRARQVDASAVVQTGAGLPTWSWATARLSWSGPVTRDHAFRLLLISPGWERLLALLRIAGLLLLTFRLLDPRRPPRALPREVPPPASPAAAALAASLFLLLLFGGARSARAEEEPAPPAPPAASDLLAELERRLTADPPCAPDCVEVSRLDLRAEGGELALEAVVHPAAPAAWALPGPIASWVPAAVEVDGRPTAALRAGEDGFLRVRLEPGVHRVRARGPARDAFALSFAVPPRSLGWSGAGWSIEGFRPDGVPASSVELARQLPAEHAGAEVGLELTPWLEVVRELDLGLPFLVHTELRRLSPPGAPVLLRVPLLPGERVAAAGVEVEGAEALIALGAEETSRRWDSTLAEAAELRLTAPVGRPWTERWVLSCSPVWNCQAAGLNPSHQMEGGTWRPEWRPWPGETLTLSLARPAAAPGTTVTRDSAALILQPGRRLRQARLELELRASRGGLEKVALPPGAELESFTVDGNPLPLELEQGKGSFILEPGKHQVSLAWREPHALGLFQRGPRVELGGPAVNARVLLDVPANRWLLWAGGPAWGSVVTIWLYLPILVLAAFLLARFAPAPLSSVDWLLLGLGLAQVQLFALLVVAWFITFALRQRFRARRWWLYDAQQLALAFLWLLALVVLYAAVHIGLLGSPDMQVAGGTSGAELAWYQDKIGGTLPEPYVFWLPIWVFRVLMLAWALWLSSRVLKWFPWAFRQLTSGPLLAGPGTFHGEGSAT